MKTAGRNSAIDILRILASFSVVMLHSAAQYWYYIPVESTEWKIANGYDALVRFGVPIFVMISGALFMGQERELSIKRVLLHNALRIMILYVVWSCLYGLLDCVLQGFDGISAKDCLKEMLEGRYHLWFLPMIAGLYVISPLIYQLVRKAGERLLRYFVYLFVIFQILRCTVEALTTNAYVHDILSRFEIPMVCSYLGYYVLGYYLVTYPIGGRLRTALRVLVLPAAVSNIVISTMQSLRAGDALGEFYDCFGIATFIIVVVIFVEILDYFGNRELKKGTERILTEIASCTLGIYLCHIGVQECMSKIGIGSAMLPMAVGIPVWAIINFLICMALAAVLRRIPIIGRYIC